MIGTGGEPKRCLTCRKILNKPDDDDSIDCGGDCWGCVKEFEKPVDKPVNKP